MSNLQLFANDAGTTLSGSITNVATSANLAAGSGAEFPTPTGGNFFLGTFIDAATGLIKEIVKVTARSGDTITMVRAQEGTTARPWNAGDIFAMLITAGSMAQMLQTGQFPSTAFTHEGLDTGAANALVITSVTPSIAAYTHGDIYNITLANTITGSSTINISGIGLIPIIRADGTATQSGDGHAGQQLLLSYDGASAQIVNYNPQTYFFTGLTNQLNILVNTSTNVNVTANKVVYAAPGGTSTLLRTSIALNINAAVNGANGLDSGALAASTWYYVFLIDNGVATAGLLSLSSTAPTLPGGYTWTKYCGAVRTNGSSQLLGTLQKGSRVQYVVGLSNLTALPILGTGTAGSLVGPSWVAIAYAAFIPPVASYFRGVASSINGQIMVAPNNSYGNATSTTNAPPVLINSGALAASMPFEFSVESTNIYWAANTGVLYALGWIDGNLEKD